MREEKIEKTESQVNRPESGTSPEGTPVQPRSSIRKWDIFRVVMRSFFVQSVWNYRTLISVGFGICLIPILKRLYDDPQSQKAFLSRHLKFFNAHPYMTSYALGVSIHLEEAVANGKAEAKEQINRVKDLLITILGALGDTLFWAAIKPASLIFGVMTLFIFQSMTMRILALTVTFLLYNVPHIYFRVKGILEGYRYGIKVHKFIHRNRFRKLESAYFYIGVSAFLLFFVFLIRTLIQENPFYLLMLVVSMTAYLFIYKFTRRFYLSIYLTLLLGIVSGMVYYHLS